LECQPQGGGVPLTCFLIKHDGDNSCTAEEEVKVKEEEVEDGDVWIEL